MFTESDIWTGGSIELLCLFRTTKVQSARLIQRAVWSWPKLVGPYMSSTSEPEAQQVSDSMHDEAKYGVALLPQDIGRVAFKITFVEDSDGLWLYAGVPLGSLGTVLPVGAFPEGEVIEREWEQVVYGWLFNLAEHLHVQVPFERAVVGWLTDVEVNELANAQVPSVRYWGYIVANREQLLYFPPNRSSHPE